MKKALCAFAVVAAATLSTASAATASTPAQTCNGTFTGATFGSIVVPDRGTCILIGSQVNGNITVKNKAYFEAGGTNITGRVTSLFSETVYIHDASTIGNGVTTFVTHGVFVFDSTVAQGSVKVIATPAFRAGDVNVCGTKVPNGNIDVLFSGSDILVGDPLTVGCAGNTARNATIVANFVDVELVARGNTITSKLNVSFNRGPAGKFVDANLGGPGSEIECRGNQSPFTASANVFTTKKGQCAGP